MSRTERLPVRLAAAAAALLLVASTAQAQFTSTVTIPRRRVLTDSGPARLQAVRDTTPRAHLSDLKAWVDSVTLYAPRTLQAPSRTPAAAPPPAAPDSAARPARPRARRRAAAGTSAS